MIEREGVNVLCQAPTEYRILAKRAELRPHPVAAADDLRRRAAQPGGDPALPGAARASGSATATGRPRPARSTGMRPDEDDPARDGSMGRPAARDRDARWSTASSRCGRRPCPASSATTSARSPSTASGGPPATTSAEDEDGYLWFEGRDDDIIITAGYRVGPFEVESALVSHPGGRRGGRGARPRRGARLGGPGDRGAGRRRALGRARRRAAGARQAGDRALQVPAHRRVRRRAAEDAERQDPAGGAAEHWRRAPSADLAWTAIGRASPASSSSPTSACSRWARRSPSSPTTSRTT